MTSITSLVGLLVVSALVHATDNYGNYGGSYYQRYPYRHGYYNYHHYKPYVPPAEPGPPCSEPKPYCKPGTYYDHKSCKCIPGGPPVVYPPRPYPPAPLPPARPRCSLTCYGRKVLDSYECRCICPARAREICRYHEELDPRDCRCYCPLSAAKWCKRDETLNRGTCNCENNPNSPGGPNPAQCPISAAVCNPLQIFDRNLCRCVCRFVVVTQTITTPGEAPGTPQAITRPGTTKSRTPGGRTRTSRSRRGAKVHLIEKRRRKKTRPGTRPGTPTITFRPGTPGRPGTKTTVRQTVPAPCPFGTRENVNCECI